MNATPDPRLDVVADLVRGSWRPGALSGDTAQRILDALDAMQPDTPSGLADHDADVFRRAWQKGYFAGRTDPRAECDHEPPAPVGLTPAQEIRLRVLEASATDDELAKMASTAAWVEHGDEVTGWPPLVRAAKRIDRLQGELDDLRARLGDDETGDPDAPTVADLIEGAGVANAAAARAEARAVLAEARLGQVADALRNIRYEDPSSYADLHDAVRAALAWTPDDTATERLRPGDPDYLRNADVINGNPLTAEQMIGTPDYGVVKSSDMHLLATTTSGGFRGTEVQPDYDDTATAGAATSYCTGCGRWANLWKCPDCGWTYCVQACQAEHTKLGTCPMAEGTATGDGDGDA